MKNILPILAFLFLPAMLFAQAWYANGSPYTISTGEDLKGLQQLVASGSDDFSGDTILLASDIALSGNWTPIGSSSRPFKGTLDGQGKTISGLTVSGVDYAGLFGYVGAGGQIKNLNVVASTIGTNNTSYAGGLAAYYASTKPVENSSAKATSISGSYSGGLVGYASAALTITNSYASGNVTGGGIGGLVGYASVALTVTNSYASGNVSSGNYGGGLVGWANGTLTITNSYASGNVNSSNTASVDNSSYSYAGGLVGYANATFTITSSYASGNVAAKSKGGGGNQGKSGYSYGGGLAGYANAAFTITNSYASGNVVDTCGGGKGASNYYNGSGYCYGGGLVGYASKASTIKTSYAIGNISSHADGGSSFYSYRGGIFGSFNSGTNTFVYYNSGNVSAAAGYGSPAGILSTSGSLLKNQGTYATWDFNEIWGIIENVSYPYLKASPQKLKVPISGGLEAEYLPVQTYTGSQIKLEPIVKRTSDKTVLTEGTDYSLQYGTNKDAGTKGTAIIIGIDGDYMNLRDTILFDITPKTITITNAAAQNKTYDGTTEATIEGALNGVAEGDNVSIGKGVFASKDAGEGISVSNVTLADASAANYKLTQPTGLTATIAKKDLTITLDPKTVKISVSDPMSVANGHIVYNGLVTGEDKSVISGTSAIFKDAIPLNTTPAAGIYPITLGGTRSANNYNYTYDIADLFLKVTGIPVNFSICAVADIPAQDYTGEQITPVGIAVTCGTTLVSEADYAISYGDNKNAGAAAGKVTITATAESELYIGSIAKTFAITPKALTVAGAQVSDKIYDGTTAAEITGTPILEGVFEGDTSDVSISSIIGAFASANAGTDIDVSINASLSGAAAENYSVTQLELTGTITAKPLTQDLIQAIVSQTYTGSEIIPSITVMDGSNILAIDTDYTLSIIENINVGTASVSIAGIGNYAGALDTTFEILPKELSNSMIAAIAEQLYTGEEITPDITVSDGNRILVAGTDYEVSYSNNVNAGTASVSITGKGNYAGEASPIAKTFAINPKALTITGAQVTGKIYDGTTAAEITGASVEGILEGDIENVSVSEITGTFATANAGTEIEVSINASLSGAAAANYSITQPALTGNIAAKPLAQDAIQAIASQTYTGSAITPSVTVKDGSKILAVGSDYTLSVINNTNAGTASVRVTGIGNYAGVADAAFAITPKNLSNSMIAEIANQFYTGEPITPHITVKDGARTLAEGTDYEVSYSNNTNTGFASVSITGKGNYASEATAHFGITESTPIRTPQIAASQIRAQSAANAIMLQNLPQNAKIEAYTMQGERIYSATSHSPLATSLSIPVSAGGIYIVKVSLGSQKQILRVPVR